MCVSVCGQACTLAFLTTKSLERILRIINVKKISYLIHVKEIRILVISEAEDINNGTVVLDTT